MLALLCELEKESRGELHKGLALPHHRLLFAIYNSLRSQEMAKSVRKGKSSVALLYFKIKKNFYIFLPLVIKIPFQMLLLKNELQSGQQNRRELL